MSGGPSAALRPDDLEIVHHYRRPLSSTDKPESNGEGWTITGDDSGGRGEEQYHLWFFAGGPSMLKSLLIFYQNSMFTFLLVVNKITTANGIQPRITRITPIGMQRKDQPKFGS